MMKFTLTIFAFLLITLNAMSQTEHNAAGRENDIAIFGGGCFWCTEAIFERLKGVEAAESGYAGGHVEHPTYGQISTGKTGHAEVVRVSFDPSVITFTELLKVFFETHDPTTLNRQGADVGTQYRSTVIYLNEAQREKTEIIIRELNQAGIWKDPIVTTLEPFEAFYSAEDYHQEYYENNPNQGYCRLVIQPKVAKFEKVFSDKLK